MEQTKICGRGRVGGGQGTKEAGSRGTTATSSTRHQCMHVQRQPHGAITHPGELSAKMKACMHTGREGVRQQVSARFRAPAAAVVEAERPQQAAGARPSPLPPSPRARASSPSHKSCAAARRPRRNASADFAQPVHSRVHHGC